MSSTAFPNRSSVHRGVNSLAAPQHPLPHAPELPLRIKDAMRVTTPDLSLECQDELALKQARDAIDRRRQQLSPAVSRFQVLLDRPADARPTIGKLPEVEIHLNPLRAWCRLQTAKFLNCGVLPPAAVLLFRVGDRLATRVFDLEEQTLINELADFQPCTLDQWSGLSALASHDELVALCEDLSASGLVCVA